MLLEVQNISKAAVVLGNTWSVNAVIISGILAMVLLANLIVAQLAAATLPAGLRRLVRLRAWDSTSSISRRFALPALCQQGVARGRPDEPADALQRDRLHPVVHLWCAQGPALGANLIGALVGGLLQSVTFVTGIRALLLIVVGLYLAALATRTRPLSVPPDETLPKPGPASAAGSSEPGRVRQAESLAGRHRPDATHSETAPVIPSRRRTASARVPVTPDGRTKGVFKPRDWFV